ncbi:MAG: UvrD-helicase domain-containing protein [Nitrosomonas sp.]|nr:UvrD-helicase domain-containing protein [Nitrosomonas sp.]MBK7364492.1 UvrD-helicase domain-containing protein [Nitrosomonas sp.]
MTLQQSIPDDEERLRLLDSQQSFLVQAPAGSGKTGLLIQRFLVLLTKVDAPEEIIAITFTRKAAHEMRQRILQALEQDQSEIAPEDNYARQTWELAQAALRCDQNKGWQLLNNPNQLRIQTIDSLCAMLVGQMPVLSQLGALPRITEDASDLYQEAAKQTIEAVESGHAWSEAIAHLITLFDNQLKRLQQLIAEMLQRRDQWLPNFIDFFHEPEVRPYLEKALIRLVEDELQKLVDQAQAIDQTEIITLVNFAAAHVSNDSSISCCQFLTALPGSSIMDRAAWEGIAVFLLTQDGNWRKKITKNEGFPAPSESKNKQEKELYSIMKQRMTALLQDLESAESFRKQLVQLRALPASRYENSQWETLQALFKLLKMAAAHLELLFQQTGQIDFPALSLAANRALGTPEAPTDLALALDYRIQHLLVDEFQDTSLNQAELLMRLIAGWQVGDGRTLFLVGDPMQSIYRFRQAEVGLFLEIRDRGVFGQIPIQFVRLAVNFRSQQEIIDWINLHFPSILPGRDDVAMGAIAYTPSIAIHPKIGEDGVIFYPYWQKAEKTEAQQVVSIIQKTKQADPTRTVAILVRNRAHLAQIIVQLRQQGLRYQAVEIERLSHRPVIQDLLALTRALLHQGDRIAWLAILRAPWCGLMLQDLLHLSEQADRVMLDALRNPTTIARLTEDGQQRLVRILPIIEAALNQLSRRPVSRIVEGFWLALGGPACVMDEIDLQDAAIFFQLLQQLEATGAADALYDSETLQKKVTTLFALPNLSGDAAMIQLMTIHKAKGLEFDVVILPGLGYSSKKDDPQLLHWMKHHLQSGQTSLLFAPIDALGADSNPITAYLKHIAQQKARYETGRLLYVAATRAKHQLHLLGHINQQDDSSDAEIKAPAKDSLLASLWPAVNQQFQITGGSLENKLTHKVNSNPNNDLLLQSMQRFRLIGDWRLPVPPASIQVANESFSSRETESIEFDWAGEAARLFGKVLHRLLQHIGKMGIEAFKENDVHKLQQIGRVLLKQSGIMADRFDWAVEQLSTAFNILWQNETAKWILSNRHHDIHSEWALTGFHQGELDHIVIDRSFIDAQAVRWIIDFKTGTHGGTDIDDFLGRELQRYRPQLERYAQLLQLMETRPIRLGLYFPILGKWLEWEFKDV